MIKKHIKSYLAALLILICALAATLISACSDGEATSWYVSEDGSSVKASLSDNGKYGFILTVEGRGEMTDYATAKDSPWYGKSGRITDVVISDGVTGIGANAFKECNVKSIVLPESVRTAGEGAFPEQALVYAYSSVNAADGRKIYYYSEKKPETADEFWRMKNGEPSVWRPVKILFIGNSFTFYSDIPALFGQIAAAAGEWVEVESVTQGSWNLTKFADKTDEYGAKVDAKLTSSDDYDVVVLQEQSTRPLNNYAAFLAAVKSFKTKINSTQSDCAIYLYATWGYEEEADSRGISIPEMENGLREAYDKAAAETGATVCHVGTAFSEVYTQYPDMLDSNSDDNAYNLYYSDKKHPSYAGAFLSACVHAATILDIDPRTSSFIGELSGQTAATFKTVAYETVYGK